MSQPQDAALTAILRGLMERHSFMAVVAPDEAEIGRALAQTMSVLTPLVRVELVALDDAPQESRAAAPKPLAVGSLATRILRRPEAAHQVADVEELLARLTRPAGTEARVVLILAGAGRLRADSFAYLQMACDLTSRTGFQLHVVFVAGTGFWPLLQHEGGRLAERVAVRHDMISPAEAAMPPRPMLVRPPDGFMHFGSRRSLAAAVAFGAFFLGGDVAHVPDAARLASNDAAPERPAPADVAQIAAPPAPDPVPVPPARADDGAAPDIPAAAMAAIEAGKPSESQDAAPAAAPLPPPAAVPDTAVPEATAPEPTPPEAAPPPPSPGAAPALTPVTPADSTPAPEPPSAPAQAAAPEPSPPELPAPPPALSPGQAAAPSAEPPPAPAPVESPAPPPQMAAPAPEPSPVAAAPEPPPPPVPAPAPPPPVTIAPPLPPRSAPPGPTQTSPAAQGMLDMLQRRGDEMLATGDVTAARRLYERGVAGRSPRAAYALASTYDPRVLSTLGVKGVPADVPKATQLYRDAIGLGSEEARAALERLLALSPDDLAKLN